MTDNSNEPTNPETSTAEPTPSKQKRVRGPAIRRLRKASAHTISKNCGEIAEALLKHTLEGNVNCAKLLFGLLERTPAEDEKRHKPRPTLASELEAEPQWDPTKHPKFSDLASIRTLIHK
jgi:hypothetical protein